MTRKVVKLFPDAEQCEEVADTPNNRARVDGPPVGTHAWFSNCCNECAFWVEPDGIHCWGCGQLAVFG